MDVIRASAHSGCISQVATSGHHRCKRDNLGVLPPNIAFPSISGPNFIPPLRLLTRVTILDFRVILPVPSASLWDVVFELQRE